MPPISKAGELCWSITEAEMTHLAKLALSEYCQKCARTLIELNKTKLDPNHIIQLYAQQGMNDQVSRVSRQ